MVLDNSALNNLEHRCEQLKPWTEYVIQMTQQELNKQFKDAIQKTGCDIKQGKNGKIIIVKKQKEEDPLAGWGDVDADMKKIDEKTHKEAEQAKKQAEQAKKQAEQAKKEAEQAKNKLKKDINDEKKIHKQAEQAKKQAEQAKKQAEQAKKQLALVSYGDEIATNLNNLLDFNQSKKEVLEILDRTFLDTNNLKQGHFYKTTQDEINLRIGTLKQIKLHYKNDKKINEKADNIIDIFKDYNENHQLIG